MDSHGYQPLQNLYKKRTGQIPYFFMGKSTISMAIFNNYISLPYGSLPAYK